MTNPYSHKQRQRFKRRLRWAHLIKATSIPMPQDLKPYSSVSMNGPNATPETDAEVEIAKKSTGHGLWVSAEFARQLERELQLAKCQLHDCCGGGVDRVCAWYSKA